MNKYRIIQDMVSFAGLELLSNGSLDFNIGTVGFIDIQTNEITSGEFIILDLDGGFSELLYNLKDKKYYYNGEPPTEPCLGGRKVNFKLTKQLIELLPEIIIEHFEEVSKSRLNARIEISNWKY